MPMTPSKLTQAPESLFWYWVNERHYIYLRREQGKPKPWSPDPIFQEYKFTNVFRELDTGTKWLRLNFLEPHGDDAPELLAFNICWYRMFNWVGTGELLGWQAAWDSQWAIKKLKTAQASGRQIFTGAHIVRSAFNMPKIDSIVDVCSDLWKMRHAIVNASELQKLEDVYELLLHVDYVGPFMAYEMVTDMRHTKLLRNAIDIMTWANPGPGALRGLERIVGKPLKRGEAIKVMQYLLSVSRAKTTNSLPNMEMRDIEHSLCEFDKYCRVKFDEGNRPRSKYNGKA